MKTQTDKNDKQVWRSGKAYPVAPDYQTPVEKLSSASVASDSPNQSNEIRAVCRHCDRSIIRENGQWIDPQATGDDSIWRETCDPHDTFNAIHEPKSTLRTMYKVNTGPRRNRYFKTLQRAKVYCAQVFERSRVVLSILETKH